MIRLFGDLFPFEDCPESDGCHERRHGVDLTFDGVKPERVGECVSESAYSRCREHCQIAEFQLLREHRDGPEQEQNRETRAEARHYVNHHCHFGDVTESEQGE